MNRSTPKTTRALTPHRGFIVLATLAATACSGTPDTPSAEEATDRGAAAYTIRETRQVSIDDATVFRRLDLSGFRVHLYSNGSTDIVPSDAYLRYLHPEEDPPQPYAHMIRADLRSDMAPPYVVGNVALGVRFGEM